MNRNIRRAIGDFSSVIAILTEEMVLVVDIFNKKLLCDFFYRIFHTVVLDDPFDDPPDLAEHIPERSPEPTKEQLEVPTVLFIMYLKTKSQEKYENYPVELLILEWPNRCG